MGQRRRQVEIDDLARVIRDDLTAADGQRAVVEDGVALLLIALLRRLDVDVDVGSLSLARRHVGDEEDVASGGRKVEIHVQFPLLVVQRCRVIVHLEIN